MSQPPRVERLFTAVDVGSSKVAAMIAGVTETKELVVLGTGWRASEGVKRGYVVDIRAAELAIRNAVEQAERLAGISVRDVWVGCSGAGLNSSISSAEVDVGGGRIEQEHIDRLLREGRDGIQPSGMMVLHAQPALYTVDGQEGVRKPKGLYAQRLGVDIHVVFADGAPVRNIATAVGQAYLNVSEVVASPIAAGMACLSDEERELGVALIEIGGQVTNVALYIRGMLVALETLPFGSGDITDAVASTFGIPRYQAERLKTVHGSAVSSRADHRTMVPVVGPNDPSPGQPLARGADEQNRIALAELNSVIRQQLDHLLGTISKVLKSMGFGGPVGQQIVLTGGGAELKGLADYAQSALGKAVRIGHPPAWPGLPEPHSVSAFTTVAGLVRYAMSDPVDIRTVAAEGQAMHRFGTGALMRRLGKVIKESF